MWLVSAGYMTAISAQRQTKNPAQGFSQFLYYLYFTGWRETTLPTIFLLEVIDEKLVREILLDAGA
jgi:hypothetical protein